MEALINSTGFILTVFGTILTIYGLFLQARSNKKKEPVYSIKSNNLISDAISKYPNLKVAYGENKVENLTVSKVLFYNRGAETLTQDDMYHTNNRTRIMGKEGVKILDVSILQRNDSSEIFSSNLRENENHMIIWFDYLDKNKGVVYQVIHTGLSSKDIDVVGSIRGVPKLTKVSPEKFMPPPTLKEASRDIVVRMSLVIISLSMMIGAGMIKRENLSFVISLALILAFLFEGIPLISKMIRGRSFPKGLERFNE